MDVIQALQQSIPTAPTLIQIAIKGMWEDTWDIPFKHGIPTNEEMNNYLEKGTEGIACEVFFQTKEGHKIIVGVRCTEKLLPSNAKEFLVATCNAIWSSKPTFSHIVEEMSKNLTGHPDSLFSIEPTGIELGVINWWKSLGSIEIWHAKQDKNISRKTLDQQLKRNSHVVKNDKNYTALELNYRVFPHYWLGIQISDKKKESWHLNKNRLEHVLKNVVDIRMV